MCQKQALGESPSADASKKPRVQRSYRDHWTLCDDDDPWSLLHQRWWGRSGKDHIKAASQGSRFLEVGQNLDIALLRRTRGFLFVPNAYEAFFKRLWNARATVDDSLMCGCLLLGQPGIGKSYFLIFFLLKCLALEEPVLYTASDGHTFFFDKTGVLSKETGSINTRTDFPPFVPSHATSPASTPVGADTRLWSLVDSPDGKEAIPEVVTYGSRRFFFVAAFLPDPSRYKRARKQAVRMWWMSPWTDDELFALTHQPPFTNLPAEVRKRCNSFAAIQSLRTEVGPCPRDIIERLSDPGLYEKRISSALAEYDDISKIIALIRKPYEHLNEHSHAIILVHRMGPISENSFESDDFFVSLKTPGIYKRVMDMFLSLELDQAMQLFKSCTGMGSQGAVFAGHLFAGLAVRYTSSEPSDQTVFRRFSPMTKADTESKKFPVRYRHQTPGHMLTVVVDGARSVKLVASLPNASKYFPPRTNDQGQVPWSHRQLSVYTEDCDLPVDNLWYYHCSNSHNAPLFDAFFYEVFEDSKVVLWVIQMMISRPHNGVGKGFAIIDRLKVRARKVLPLLPVEVKYVLVVPYRMPGWDVEWNFVADFQAHEGDLFIQQLDLGILSGGACMPEDIFGPTMMEEE